MPKTNTRTKGIKIIKFVTSHKDAKVVELGEGDTVTITPDMQAQVHPSLFYMFHCSMTFKNVRGVLTLIGPLEIDSHETFERVPNA